MSNFISFDSPYFITLQKSLITSIKLHGDNVMITTTDGNTHRINKREYSYDAVLGMLEQETSAPTPKPKAQVKKTLDKK